MQSFRKVLALSLGALIRKIVMQQMHSLELYLVL